MKNFNTPLFVLSTLATLVASGITPHSAFAICEPKELHVADRAWPVMTSNGRFGVFTNDSNILSVESEIKYQYQNDREWYQLKHYNLQDGTVTNLFKMDDHGNLTFAAASKDKNLLYAPYADNQRFTVYNQAKAMRVADIALPLAANEDLTAKPLFLDGNIVVFAKKAYYRADSLRNTVNRVLRGQVENSVVFWNQATKKQIAQFKPGTSTIKEIQFASDRLALASDDGLITVIDTKNNLFINQFSTPKNGIFKAMDLSANGRYVLGENFFGVTKIWNVESGDEVFNGGGETGFNSLTEAKFIHGGKYLFTLNVIPDHTYTVKIFDMRDQRQVVQFNDKMPTWENPNGSVNAGKGGGRFITVDNFVMDLQVDDQAQRALLNFNDAYITYDYSFAGRMKDYQ